VVNQSAWGRYWHTNSPIGVWGRSHIPDSDTCLWMSSKGSLGAPSFCLNATTTIRLQRLAEPAPRGNLAGLTQCSRYVLIPQWGTLRTICLSRFEQWDATGARIAQTLSAVADLKLRRAAFAEAVRQRPAQRILLRDKTRVIEEYKQ
jgi:cyanate permease